MKILNISYRKVTWWMRNSWILGRRHLPVNQGSLDISTSLINKHTNTVQANLFDCNTDDAAKTLDMTSWVSITFTRIRVGCQHFPQHSGQVPKALKVHVGQRIQVRMHWGRRFQQDYNMWIMNSHPKLYSHSSHEEIFSCILFFLPPTFMGCTFCASSYTSSRYKGKICCHGA